MATGKSYASVFGFTSMLGGALFGLFIIMFTTMGNVGGEAQSMTANSLVLLSFGFLLPGTFGLYTFQRDVLGWPARLSWVVFFVGMTLVTGLGVVQLVTEELPYGDVLGLVQVVLLVTGAVTFGAVTAYKNEFTNGRLGGSLLAVSLPLSFGSGILLSTFSVSLPLVSTFIFGSTFGSAWMLLGLDMLTANDGSVPAAAGTEPSGTFTADDD